jgi:type II secretory pathway pseudopilin PulG
MAININQQRGYTLLTVVFFAAVLLITAMAALPDILTQGRREREQEMIWRGEQYVRGIRLFYMKNNRYPKSIEELTRPQLGIRFMRKAYKDPMNVADGSWRMIYVGPMGQIIGSKKWRPVNLKLPGPVAAGLATGTDKSPGTTASVGTDANMKPADPNSAPESQSSLSGDGTIIGGNIIGVGSKIDRRSFRLYDGADSYLKYEFIWDTSKSSVVSKLPIIAPGEIGQQPANQQVAPK